MNHIEGPVDRRLRGGAGVQQPAQDLVVDAVVELAAEKLGTRRPVPVGVDVGEFPVDIGHPDEAVAEPR